MKTPILNTAIAIALGLIILSVVVPQFQSKGINNSGVAAPAIVQPEPIWNLSERASAGEELPRLDETYNVVVRLLKRLEQNPVRHPKDAAKAYSDLLHVAYKILENTSGWKAACQRVVDGDFALRTTLAMDSAIAEAKWCREELKKHQSILEMITKEPEKWARQKEQERQHQKAEERKRQSGEGLGMTMEGYRFLRNGMGKMEVDQILGCFGVEQSNAEGITLYAWKKGFAIIIATFDGDKLIAKSQSGLYRNSLGQ
jgi:hypothetical protein